MKMQAKMLGTTNSSFDRTGMQSAMRPANVAKAAEPIAPYTQFRCGAKNTKDRKTGKPIHAVHRKRAAAVGFRDEPPAAPVPTSDFGGA